MTQVIDSLTESDARREWHRLLNEMGFDEFTRRCKVEVIREANASPIYRITVAA